MWHRAVWKIVTDDSEDSAASVLLATVISDTFLHTHLLMQSYTQSTVILELFDFDTDL